MAIELPRAIGGAPGRRRRSGLPTIDDVPQVRQRGESVPRVPDVARFVGSDEVGEGLRRFGQGIVLAAERQQKEFDAIETTKAELAFKSEGPAELRRLQVESDPTDPEFTKNYEKWLGERKTAILSTVNPKVSPFAREKLSLEIDAQLGAMRDSAGQVQLLSTQKKTQDLIGQQRNIWSSQAARDPDALPFILEDIDKGLERYNGTMTKDQFRDQRALSRRATVEASINALIDGGRHDEADRLINGPGDGTPGLYDADLTEASREQMRNGLDRAMRQQIAREEAQERRNEREMKRAQGANEATILLALDMGQDVPDSMLRSSLALNRITADGYKMLVERKQKNLDGRDNPRVVVDLNNSMIASGDDIHGAIIRAVNNKQLSASTASSLIAENQRRLTAEGKEDFRTADEKQAFQYMSKWLGGDKLAFSWDDDTARRVAQAQREFRDRMAEGKEKPQTIADDLVLKFAKNDPLPPVGYIGDTDTSSADGVKQAGQKLRALRDSKRITQDAYEREMRILRQHSDRLPAPTVPAPGAKK